MNDGDGAVRANKQERIERTNRRTRERARQTEQGRADTEQPSTISNSAYTHMLRLRPPVGLEHLAQLAGPRVAPAPTALWPGRDAGHRAALAVSH